MGGFQAFYFILGCKLIVPVLGCIKHRIIYNEINQTHQRYSPIKFAFFLYDITSIAMETTCKRKASKLKLLAFLTRKKFKFHGKRYSDEVKDIICKIADWVKLVIEKQNRGQRLILSETAAEQTCAICKISESTFYRTSKTRKGK